MWSEKYRPKKLAMMVGNEEARIDLHNWLKKWEKGRKPALLIGPPGVGKTTAVYALASEQDYQVIELNASDSRTKLKLESKLGPAITTESILGGRRLIFLDEVDGLHGRQDYGGVEFIQEIIKSGTIPMVMAANVEDDNKVGKLMGKSHLIRFRRIPPPLVEMYLKHILKQEGRALPNEAIRHVVGETEGEVRASINTLQAMASESTPELIDISGRRDISITLDESLNNLFETNSGEEALRALRTTSAPARDKIRGLFSSIVASALEPKKIGKALDALSRADMVLGEIGSTQKWRLLRYFDRLLAYFLIDALERGSVRYRQDDLPWNMKLRIWNESRAIRTITDRIGKIYNVSKRDATNLYLPYFLVIVQGTPELTDKVKEMMSIDEPTFKVMGKETRKMMEVLKN